MGNTGNAGDAKREEIVGLSTGSSLPNTNLPLADGGATSLLTPASTAYPTSSSSCTTAAAAAAVEEVPRISDGDEDELTVTKSLHVRRDWYSTLATFVAGGVAGAASRTLTAPLDRIKLIAQEGHLVQPPSDLKTSAGGAVGNARAAASLHRTHPSLLQVARLIKADGGWQAFWRGNVINCFKAGPEFAIVFSIRRYLSSLYEDCAEREKRRRKRSIAQWKGHDERSFAISLREEEERASMMGSSASSTSKALADASRASRSTSHHPGSDATPTRSPHSLSPASSSSAHSSSTPDWHYLTPQELHERERVISAEASIFTPPFNRIGCLSSIPQLLINCVVGAIAGLGAQGLLYPLEVVKTRAVVSRSNEYRGGFREIVRSGYREGGIKEFYKGFTPNMVGIVVYRGLEMGLYSSAQQSIMLYRMQVLKMNRHEASLNSAEVGLVGMFASTVAQTVSYPLNVIRTRLQTQGTNGRAKKYNGMLDCCVKMIRNKGVTSLFSGLTANYLKAVPASACTFVVFEWTQRQLVDDDS
ncbi:putative mitochondrial Mitochondrial carrier protein-like protein [Leptomonas pyrrhocoris]|uniref:Putative mitochondrial Mitochondrial carrier protein-like protein n=1 Tax=Leptomonas pyrrhocoris TaxID=157538 RepID=A0A0M9G4R2_LEPPY|nr:putative mitochondrial Mitochondrial carrier protein-like protein [Leptomonas pyrrhocoris]KPA82390.1 putative mitochondrial Mitochondrial carrier protein-like protein [Leptomonas pyrrhocoris]|eukprot:XP_015660829.1 putative mitochondrial Mitochondrial carrier protein-like protein [Leptomonas pyrrhocoris]